MNDDQTKFYEQVLKLEPESRLFFPLAQLYFEKKQINKARNVLSKGLEKHPHHFEARLLFATVLTLEGEQDLAGQIYRDIFSLLRGDRYFWENLTGILSSQGENDLSLAAAFFACSGAGKTMSWSDVLKAGMDNMRSGHHHGGSQSPGGSPKVGERENQGFLPEACEFDAAGKLQDYYEVIDTHRNVTARIPLDDTYPASDAANNSEYDEEFDDPEELADFDIDNEARTKSMADILFGQEEYVKAHDIYLELWRRSLPGDERKELEKMIARSEQAMSLVDQIYEQDRVPGDDETGIKYDKNEAINFLMTLADRLEAKSA